MLVMFSDNNVLILALTNKDLATMAEGRTLEYINPPHAPQLIRDIVVLHAPDKQKFVEQLRATGVKVTEASRDTFEKFLNDERTDRGHTKPS